MMTHQTLRFLLVLGISALAAPASAQQTTQAANPEGLHLSRAELQETLTEYEATANSSEYSRDMREHARRTAERIRLRLEQGDFQAGDRVMLEVRQEPELSDEFTVEPGRTLTLPGVGVVSLEGVLRSELQGHLQEELSQYIRNPVVQARALVRLAIVGEVGQPGFYTLPASTILEDAVMTAGGPSGNANLDRIRIERSGEAIWEDEALQTAMLEGRTLDQLSLRAGDRIIIPEQRPGLLSWTRIHTVIVTAASLVLLYTRVF